MNEHLRKPIPRSTTQGAEGLPRLRWTLAEFDRLFEIGILGEDDRVELIEGEIVPLAAKGNRHDLVKDELAGYLTRATGPSIRISTESGWSPIENVYHEPDIRLYPKTFQPRAVPASELLLLIEVADSSLAYDLGRKAQIYAALGVREYWVVEAWALVTHVHHGPSGSGYATVRKVPPSRKLAPSWLPDITVKIGDLGIA